VAQGKQKAGPIKAKKDDLKFGHCIGKNRKTGIKCQRHTEAISKKREMAGLKASHLTAKTSRVLARSAL